MRPASPIRWSKREAPGSRRRSSWAGHWGADSSDVSATSLAAAGRCALTILTYAAFTGLSFFAQTWWQLLIFRFVAALGIGGEWAVGSCLLAETWPSHWRPWIAAVLQTAVNIGVLIACAVTYALTSFPLRCVFLVGIVPALLVFWIRRNVPEPEEWEAARSCLPGSKPPAVRELFAAPVRRTTLLTIGVCASSLTAWWAFLFWNPQHLRNLPDLQAWSRPDRERLVSAAFFLVIATSIFGNFFAGWLAQRIGYRNAIAWMCLGFLAAMLGAYGVPRDHASLMPWIAAAGFFSGVFGLFTMYLPPLFPTLLRTTGAGFSYNIGRIFAAAGTVIFGLFSHVGDFRVALLCDSLLMIPAMIFAMQMPQVTD